MKKLEIENLNLKSKHKQKDFFRLELFDLIDGSNIGLPIAIVGQGNEKIVTIVAAQHGNEWNGSFACHNLFNQLDPAKMKGKVVILPMANPFAFIQRGRVSSLDHIDMNRVYGFVKNRKPTEHLAKIIFDKFCAESDFVFDLHGGGPGEYLPVVEVISEKRFDLAKSLGLGNILLRKKDAASLVPNCERQGVKAFSIEAGRALKINQKYSEKMAKGILNFLKKINIYSGDVRQVDNQKIYSKKLIVASTCSGFFEPKVSLGDTVSKNQEICTVWPLFQEEPRIIKSSSNGTIIYLRNDQVINQGESVVHIAK